jgi:citrate lyase subunit alpha/citrate CoA-transferase
MNDVYRITGKPEKPRFTELPVALVEWRDGSIIDTVWQMAE